MDNADNTTDSIAESWLNTLSEITSFAQTGIHYSKDVYDVERYHKILTCVEKLLIHKNINTDNLLNDVLKDVGYATPKTDVRAVVFKDEKLLLVQESTDDLWSLPGGWADVGYSAGENAVKEVFEETGLEVTATKLLSLLDRRKHDHPPMFLHVYKAFFLCEIIGGELRGSVETLEAKFFAENEIPPMSEARVTHQQVVDIFESAKNGWSNTDTLFD